MSAGFRPGGPDYTAGMDERLIENFAEAARWVEALVGRLDPSAWDGPGLGDWSMRALVGHTSRSLLTVESYMKTTADEVALESPEAYFAFVATQTSTDPGAVFERGVAAGEALGSDPGRALSAIADRVIPLVQSAEDRVMTTAAGPMLLSAYLPTRTFELTVHGLDIAAAAAITASAPDGPLVESLGIAARLAALGGDGERVLLALTGRTALGDRFSVLD